MDAITEATNSFVQQGLIAGAATLVWRDRVVHAAGVGLLDLEAGLPVERDTIFRIASMTKPITATAALMLYDEGLFALDDPITRWAPEFTDMRVLRSPEGALDDTVAALRPIRMLDLLTHRAGFTYGGFHAGPIGPAYADALGMDIDSPLSPDDWIAALASLPLIDQPGGLPLRGVQRAARPVDRAHRRAEPWRPAGGAHLPTAGHEGHRLHRPAAEARPAGEDVRLRRRGQAGASAGPSAGGLRLPG